MKMTKESLSKLRVKDLRALIVKQNLHNVIRRYSVMRDLMYEALVGGRTECKCIVNIYQTPVSVIPNFLHHLKENQSHASK